MRTNLMRNIRWGRGQASSAQCGRGQSAVRGSLLPSLPSLPLPRCPPARGRDGKMATWELHCSSPRPRNGQAMFHHQNSPFRHSHLCARFHLSCHTSASTRKCADGKLRHKIHPPTNLPFPLQKRPVIRLTVQCDHLIGAIGPPSQMLARPPKLRHRRPC
jgi:hypothetical protein